jgi:hypothetical protein
MYADDLILLSISLTGMQRIIDICVADCKVIDMEINSKKSAGMRIGRRHNFSVQSLYINGQVLSWKNEIRYLGIVLTLSKQFNFNIQNSKHQFFRALNEILEKVGLNAFLEVLCLFIQIVFQFSCTVQSRYHGMLNILKASRMHICRRSENF